MTWGPGEGALDHVVREQTESCLAVYARDPKRIEEDANNERRIAEGGYRDRQLHELVQNAVDAARVGGGRIEVRLTKDTLYVANDGEPFSASGVEAIMASDISSKTGDRIGRFGIGFKSVLAVTGEPRIYSRSVSLAFEKAWAERTIRAAGLTAPRYPTMRVARVADAGSDAGSDPILADMMAWASTVIVLPALTARGALLRDLAGFRSEFLLFSPHISETRFIIDGAADRTFTRTGRPDGTTVLSDGESTSVWRVFSANWTPTAAARLDGGRIADRETVRLDWAVPFTGKEQSRVGEFWSYFPTTTRTTMSGIINAPWRLSDDRTNLLPGAFNEGLLEDVFPNLVSRNVGHLMTDDDPAVLLDLLPARGREGRNWADDTINEPVFAQLRRVACLPDATGMLRLPTELDFAPEGVEPEWVAEWSRARSAPLTAWVHPLAFSVAERRLKVRRLADPTGDRSATAKEWLEAIVQPGDVESCAAAIRLAARIFRETVQIAPGNVTKRQFLESMLRARIVPLEDGEVVPAVKGRVFIRSGPDDASGVFVDPRVAGLPGVTEALSELGVTVLDKRAEFESAVSRARGNPEAWGQVWVLAREVPREFARTVLEANTQGDLVEFVRVRTAQGHWVRLDGAVLGGSVVPTHGRRDADHLIDPQFHAHDQELLRDLGAVSEPEWRTSGQAHEIWLGEYRAAMKDTFRKSSKLSIGLDEILFEDRPVLWPLGFFGGLSEEGRLEMTRIVLAKGPIPTWRLKHATDPRIKAIHVLPPEFWLIRKHGRIDTSLGPMRPRDAVMPRDDVRTDLYPVAHDLSLDVCERLGVRNDAEEFTEEQWRRLKAIADAWPDDDRRFAFYSHLPGVTDTTELVVRVGLRRERVAAANVGVTDSPAVYESMLEAAVPAMLVGTGEAEHFRAEIGLRDGKDLLREEVVADEVGEAVYLADEYPPIKNHPRLGADDLDLKLQRCRRIVRLVATPVGQVERPLTQHREPGRILVTAIEPAEVLAQVSVALKLGMTVAEVQRVLQTMQEMRASQLKREVRKAARISPEAGLVAAIGVDNLRAQVPRQALKLLSSEGELSPTEVAHLVLSVHGVGVLKALRPMLDERRLDPPREFSGRRKERQWVAELGFPPEWAGFPTRPSPAREAIDGPITLLPLHDYQVRVTEKIRALLLGIGRQRGVVSLPTGAGKTRVTIQALVEEIARGRLASPIVWIAQSEELCEQAAESWAYVWRALGPAEQLVLGRLWGGNTVEEEPDGFQVVIAIDATLNSIIASRADEYAWLQEPSVVVVDEAHTSVSSRYTEIFEWLGRGTRVKEARPLIGLTATPFRGTSDDETTRLVRRYDANLLDEGVLGVDPYLTLQDMGVLAKVEKRTLAGATIDFTDEELAEIHNLGRFPQRREQQLGDDQERNSRIVESILALPDDWQILLFAPSVENARALAALLSHRGAPAVAVSSGTEPSARRHYIDQFRKGGIRVLTNYQVLAQGFDAPAVKAVYVCRPTFSPNVYQQMVGRGLRGPLNGGSEKVLIVDVEDNLSRYGEQLAFRAFERLWKQ